MGYTFAQWSPLAFMWATPPTEPVYIQRRPGPDALSPDMPGLEAGISDDNAASAARASRVHHRHRRPVTQETQEGADAVSDAATVNSLRAGGAFTIPEEFKKFLPLILVFIVIIVIIVKK